MALVIAALAALAWAAWMLLAEPSHKPTRGTVASDRMTLTPDMAAWLHGRAEAREHVSREGRLSR